MPNFELIEHTADIGVKAFGKTIEELFENVAIGMYNIICENFSSVRNSLKYENEFLEPDLETLLVSFLNDLLFQTFINRKLFYKFEIKINQAENNFYKIFFICYGENYDEKIHGHIFEIKSATFHDLKIKKTSEGFECVVIFDV